LWADPDGVVEIDVTGVGRQQLGSLLASVGRLGEQEYEALFAPR
jgi:hypothetical protein